MNKTDDAIRMLKDLEQVLSSSPNVTTIQYGFHRLDIHMIELAIAALEKQREMEPMVLTLDELRQLDGKPAYIQCGDGQQFWAIVAIDGESIFFHSPDWDGNELDPDFYAMYYDKDPDGHFGLHILGWIAFDREPTNRKDD